MSYTGKNPKDLLLTEPAIGAALVSELDDADRQQRMVTIYGFAAVTTTAAATYDVLETDHLVICSYGAMTATLPLIADVSSTTVAREFVLMNSHATNSMLVSASYGNTTPVNWILPGERVTFYAVGGTAWSASTYSAQANQANSLLADGGYRIAATANTANAIVRRDASGNFAAGTITASLTGNVAGNVVGNVAGNVTGNVAGNVVGDVIGNVTGNTSGSSGSCSGNAAGIASPSGTHWVEIASGGGARAAGSGWSVALRAAGAHHMYLFSAYASLTNVIRDSVVSSSDVFAFIRQGYSGSDYFFITNNSTQTQDLYYKIWVWE